MELLRVNTYAQVDITVLQTRDIRHHVPRGIIVQKEQLHLRSVKQVFTVRIWHLSTHRVSLVFIVQLVRLPNFRVAEIRFRKLGRQFVLAFHLRTEVQ